MAKMTRMPVSEGFGLMYVAGKFPSRHVRSGDVDRPVKRPEQLPSIEVWIYSVSQERVGYPQGFVDNLAGIISTD